MGAFEMDSSATAYRGRADDEDEDEDEQQQVGKRKRITQKVLKGLIKEQSLYKTASLNDKLYLHYGGYDKIENLEEWTGLRALWIEGNGFDKIQGLNPLTQLRCLYLQQNCLKRIEGLECCPLLAQLNLANNFISTIEGLSSLRHLSTLQIANNHLTTADDLTHLLEVPTITVLDLQNNRLEEAEVLDVLEAMPVLAVVQLQGNTFVPKITQYRRNTVSRCRALSYLDDRPVFEEERLAVDAWSVGGLPAEREERRRQREEKDQAHRRNLEYMMSFSGKKRIEVGEGDAEEQIESAAQAAEFAKKQAALLAEEKMTEKQMYERALEAVERKRAELLRLKAERQRALAAASGEEAPAEDGGAEAEAVDKAKVAPPGGIRFADKSAEQIVHSLEAPTQEMAEMSVAMPTAPPTAPPPASFESSDIWDGARAGKVYKRGDHGMGYYEDAATTATAPTPTATAPTPTATAPTPTAAAPLESAEVKSAEVDDLDELD